MLFWSYQGSLVPFIEIMKNGKFEQLAMWHLTEPIGKELGFLHFKPQKISFAEQSGTVASRGRVACAPFTFKCFWSFFKSLSFVNKNNNSH